jgi:hypothetical protein
MAVHYNANAAHSFVCHVSCSFLMFYKLLLDSCSAFLAKDAQGHDVLVSSNLLESLKSDKDAILCSKKCTRRSIRRFSLPSECAHDFIELWYPSAMLVVSWSRWFTCSLKVVHHISAQHTSPHRGNKTEHVAKHHTVYGSLARHHFSASAFPKSNGKQPQSTLRHLSWFPFCSEVTRHILSFFRRKLLLVS